MQGIGCNPKKFYTLDPEIVWAIFFLAIMMYRISSMYNHTRKIIVLLLSVFAIEFMGLVTVNLYYLRFWTRKIASISLTLHR